MRDADEQQLDRVLTLVGDVLGTDAVGAYLFGSAVLGGLQPRSDLDLFVVSKRETTREEKQRLVDRLLAISGRSTPHGMWRRVELTIVVESEIRPWRYPPRFDFQYGQRWRGAFESGSLAPSPRATPRGSSARRPRPVTPAPSGSRSPLRDRRVPRAPSQAAAHSVRSGSRSPGWCLPATRLGGYRALDEVGADRAQPLGSADLELPVRLAGSAVEPGRVDGQLRQQFGNRQRLRAVRVDQLAVGPKAGRRPAVLLVDAALRRIVSTRRRLQRPRTQVPQQPDEGARPLERRRLVGRANLERPELRVRTNVPPEARVRARQPGRDHALDEGFPLRVGADRRRGAGARQEAEHLCADGEHPRFLTREVRRVRGEREHERQPGQDRLQHAKAVVRARHPDVDVQTAHALAPSARTRILDELAVALVGRDLLPVRTACRMRPRSSNDQPVLARDLGRSTPQLGDPVDRLVGRGGDLVRGLDHRRVQLRLENAGQAAALGPCDDLLDRRYELQRLGVQDPKLLLDADGEGRSEEHTSELQSRENLVCRLLLEKKK